MARKVRQMGYGFQLSGLYFYASGQRTELTYGGDFRRVGTASNERLRRDGTITPRHDDVGDPLHRVDMRLQKRFNLGGSVTLDGLAEVFNLFNHENYGRWETRESNRRFGQPREVADSGSSLQIVAFQARGAQFGFRPKVQPFA